MINKYEFKTQLAKGQKYEEILDEHFTQWYKIKPVSLQFQRLGIDRVFTDENDIRITVEYKTDFRAEKTGNVFIELISVDKTQKPGWVQSSIAQLLVYYIPGRGIITIPMMEIKKRIKEWMKKYNVIYCANKTYKSWGLVIPISEIE